MAWDRDAFENAMIEDMRAHDGVVTSGPLAGHPLLILTSTGAKSGEPRRAILTFTQDAGDYVVAGTAGDGGRRGRPGRARPAVGPARRRAAELRRLSEADRSRHPDDPDHARR